MGLSRPCVLDGIFNFQTSFNDSFFLCFHFFIFTSSLRDSNLYSRNHIIQRKRETKRGGEGISCVYRNRAIHIYSDER